MRVMKGGWLEKLDRTRTLVSGLLVCCEAVQSSGWGGVGSLGCLKPDAWELVQGPLEGKVGGGGMGHSPEEAGRE